MIVESSFSSQDESGGSEIMISWPTTYLQVQRVRQGKGERSNEMKFD